MLDLLTSKWAGILLFILILGGGVGFFLYRDGTFSKNGDNTPAVATSTDDGYTIEQVPVEEAISAPDYNRPFIFAPNTTEEVKKAIILNIADLTARLKKSTLDFDAWLTLGTMYKIAGDYEGARIIWEYLGVVSPGNYPSFASLGDLYHRFLKEYSKAETNYLKAIGNEKTYIDGYRSLYELYRYSYTGKTAQASKILEQGIAANPKATDLMIVLAGYYKDMGDKAKALIYYEKALAEAERLGNQQLIDSLRTEINSLK